MAFPGCGGDDTGGIGGGGELPDGHVQQGCNVDVDCDDGNKCHKAKCQSHVCTNPPVDCPAPDECNVGVCDEQDGSCSTTAGNEGGACTSMNGQPGTCTVGYCQPVPNCYDPQNSYNSVECGGYEQDDSNDPATSYSNPTLVLDTYGCATGETGPEVAYQFTAPVEGDVTLSMTSTALGADGGAGPDLDLIVLDGSCTQMAACMNPALPGGGYQGVTAGSGSEKVTFRALTGRTYYAVVEGKNGAIGNFKLKVDWCGSCNATTAAVISCNQSMAVAGDTSKGQSKLASYTCITSGTSTQMVSAAGKEQTFHFTASAPVNVRATAKIVNASSPVTLLALPSASGACDPLNCAGSANTAGGTASVSFTAVPDYSDNIDYWVVADTQTSDATYGLTLACDPYCSNYYGDYIDCSLKSVTGSNNQYGSTNDVSAWGPAAAACGGMSNLSGAEYVYLFHKTTTTNLPKYRFTLASTTDNKHLALVILDAGATSPASCDPRITCANTAPVAVAATTTGLASTGTYVAAAKGTSDGGTKGKTAVVDLTTGTLTDHYYWVIVDGVTGDAGSYALSIDSGCM